MDRTGGHVGLLERILGAPERVVVVTGPARAGKTTAAVEMYEHFSAAPEPPRCLLMAPSSWSAAALRRTLLTRSPTGVLVAPQVVTFTGLAGRILAATPKAGQVISPFARHLLLREVVARLASSGGLTALSAVADTPGLVVALDRAIAELKRAAVDPDALAKAVGNTPGKRRDLLAVYRRYQERLRANGLYDVEGQMWEARDELAAAGAELPGLTDIRAIAVDGFTDFTPTQLEILRLAAARIERVLITLPFAEDGRERMWHWTRRTLNGIRRAFGSALAEIAAEPGRPPALCDGLFRPDEPQRPPGDDVHVIAAPDVQAEVTEVARRIKRLLAGGAAAGSIAVTGRSLAPYRPTIERIFAEFDIPVAAAAQALTDVPIIRFLLDVASLEPKFAFGDVLRVIKNSYFRPEALGPFDSASVAAAEMIIREGNVLAGRAAYAAAAERLARRVDAADEDESLVPLGPSAFAPETLTCAAAMLTALFDLAERLRDPGQLPAAAAALFLADTACGHGQLALVARDLRALAVLSEALGQMTEPYPPADHLREALHAVTCPPAAGESAVDVLDVLDARPLRYEHLFLLGLDEGRFPRRFADSALLGEAERAAWATRGLVLDSRGDLAAREMLLFYLAGSRARAGLTLSFIEAETGTLGASSFLESLLEPVGGSAGPRVFRIRRGRFGPTTRDGRLAEQQIGSPGEAMLAAVAGTFGGEGSAGPGPAAAWVAKHAHRRLRRAAMGIYARYRRWLPGPVDRFDGQIDRTSLLRKLQDRFGDDQVYSASQLNTFGTCPWSFFAKYVLRLEPLVCPERRLDPQPRGTFVHDVLFDVFAQLAAEGDNRVVLARVPAERLVEVLDTAVARQARAVEARRPPYPAMWRVQLDQMRSELRDYLLRARADELPAAGIHFELAFGIDEATIVTTPAGPIRVRGRIDRVDLVAFAERTGLLVVDYKTGALPTRKDILEGRQVQLPLYAAALANLLEAECFGGVYHRVGPKQAQTDLFFAAVKRARGAYAPAGEYQTDHQAAMAAIGGSVEGMRAGRFGQADGASCPSWCPYRRICHCSPARAAVKGSGDG